MLTNRRSLVWKVVGANILLFENLMEIFRNRRLQDDGVVDPISEEAGRRSSPEVQQADLTVLTLGWKTKLALVAIL